jgi:hypothetical protein
MSDPPRNHGEHDDRADHRSYHLQPMARVEPTYPEHL